MKVSLKVRLVCIRVQTDVDRSDVRFNHSKSTTDVTKCKQLEWKSGLANRSSKWQFDDEVLERTAWQSISRGKTAFDQFLARAV